MTTSQANTVERIRKYVLENDCHNNPEYEIKTWDVEETDYGVVRVYCVAGRVNDEGTMAAMICRDIRHIFIGLRGGVTAYGEYVKGKAAKTYKGWWNVMIYGRHS